MLLLWLDVRAYLPEIEADQQDVDGNSIEEREGQEGSGHFHPILFFIAIGAAHAEYIGEVAYSAFDGFQKSFALFAANKTKDIGERIAALVAAHYSGNQREDIIQKALALRRLAFERGLRELTDEQLEAIAKVTESESLLSEVKVEEPIIDEKDLLELFNAADPDIQKAAVSVLKGEAQQAQNPMAAMMSMFGGMAGGEGGEGGENPMAAMMAGGEGGENPMAAMMSMFGGMMGGEAGEGEEK